MRKFIQIPTDYRKFPDIDLIKPQRTTEKSAAYDIYSNENVMLKPGESHMFWTDFAAQMDNNNFLMVVPRSGNAVKSGIIMKNTIGIIDADYFANQDNYGNIGVCLVNTGNHSFGINKGDRIAQSIFQKYEITEDDDASGERKGGYGSSGK